MNGELRLENASRNKLKTQELDRIFRAVPLYLRIGPGQVGVNRLGFALWCAELFMVAYDDKTDRFFRLDPLEAEPPLPLTTTEVEHDLKMVIQVFANRAASTDSGVARTLRAMDPKTLIEPLKKVALPMPRADKQPANTPK